MNSLRARIAVLWTLLALMSLLVVFVLWTAHRSGPDALVAAAKADTAAACRLLRQFQQRLVPVDATHDAVLLNVIVDLSLRDAIGIEGGVWDASRGYLAYAFPTHEGASRKTDVPQAELPAIDDLVRRVSTSQPELVEARHGQRETSVIAACTMPDGKVAWTFERVPAAQAKSLQRVDQAAALGLALVVLAGAWLLSGLRTWNRKLRRLETALVERGDTDSVIEPAGERDLDRLILAFNHSSRRISGLSQASERLTAELAQSERLASLGRVAAGLAHEIRNPLGSMRLRAENALALQGDAAPERRRTALVSVLRSVDRLEALVDSLLALTRPLRPERREVDIEPWLRDLLANRSDQALAAGVELTLDCPENRTASFDPAALGRAIDNLLQNAIQHTPSGGEVRLTMRPGPSLWRLTVQDSGPGVAPALQPRLFEPFATGRAEGTGLGLALTREIVIAHGGRLRLMDSAPEEVSIDASASAAASPGLHGARFEVELPWR